VYGKVFASIFDGSLYGHFEATAVMMALIALADKNGFVDMTPRALAARTGFPMDLVERGLAELSAPDPDSRSHECEGRRIVLIDPERAWGWRLVNHAKYRGIRSNDERADYMRDYMAKRRSVNTPVNNVNQPLTQLAHTEADTDTKEVKKKTRSPSAPDDVSEEVWQDWLALRKSNRAAVTATALQGIRAEASKANLTLEAALRTSCERGWAGFRADWVGGGGSEADKLFDRLEAEGRA
jgi:hypothetical protein